MAKTVPMILTNNNILIKDKDTDEFKAFSISGLNDTPNIPFYHQYAQRIAQSQYYFKDFMTQIYGKKLSKLILAIIVPDDTSKLESIFINEFFVNSEACKAVAQMKMSQALSKEYNKYISISKTIRNVVLTYVKDNEIVVSHCYDVNNYDVTQVVDDASKIHIDVEYNNVPIFVNNINHNMEDFFFLDNIITPKEFLEKIAVIDVEKI